MQLDEGIENREPRGFGTRDGVRIAAGCGEGVGKHLEHVADQGFGMQFGDPVRGPCLLAGLAAAYPLGGRLVFGLGAKDESESQEDSQATTVHLPSGYNRRSRLYAELS